MFRTRNLKAACGALVLMTLTAVAPIFAAKPDEGMFMPDKIVTLPLKKRGLKIKPEEIYNPNGGGLSEAVGRVNIGAGGSGTGEFISSNGLILTNHHVAFDGLVEASTPEKNFGEMGFRADSTAQEMPFKGYSFMITLKSEDVTAQVLSAVNASMSEAQRAEAIKTKIAAIESAEKARVGSEVVPRVQSLNNGLYYYLMNTMVINDIRVVYAPPKNVGYFGGDPDNFEWTRHCGDFTFLRAYVAPDGKPAEYSPNNVPYKPKKYLSWTMEGLKEDDLTMIIGYPGGTTRYRESFSIAYNENVRMPFLVEYFDAQIKALQKVGEESEAKKVATQSDIFSFANTYKVFDGGLQNIRRSGLLERRRTEEAAFVNWINADETRRAKYGDVMEKTRAAYDEFNKSSLRDYILQIGGNSQMGLLASVLGILPNDRAKQAVQGLTQNREIAADREMNKFFLRKFAELPEGQKVAAVEKLFGALKGDERRQAEEKFASELAENKVLTNADGLNMLLGQTPEQRRTASPTIAFLMELAGEIKAAAERTQKFNTSIAAARLPYTQGMAEMKGITPYPDANSTMRFSYGSVKGYMPKEAVIYTPFTTLSGVIAKDTGREPFNVPERLKQIYTSRDFGQYEVNGNVPVNFLSTNDIIGGNSGSPVLNAKGEQVGIAFDGNFEGLGNDFFFNPNLCRTINVDIRYVMFITEKFGNAGWILNEINISGRPKAKSAKK